MQSATLSTTSERIAALPTPGVAPQQAHGGAQPAAKEYLAFGQPSGTRCRSFAARRPPVFRPTLEGLEERVVPYALSGFKWANTAISASIMPDGSLMGTYPSNLFSTYDAKYATATWQREFARALQTWAASAPLDFHFVADTGAAQGISGLAQGDSRFGDIRLGGYLASSSYLAYTYYPSTSSTRGGDLRLNTSKTFNIGLTTDLYSVLVHEVGHALGVGHSTVSGSVMYSSVRRVYTGLAADDVAAIRAIYGARPADSYDARAANNTLTTATAVSIDPTTGGLTLTADMTTTTDVDYYKLVVPTGSNGTVSVSVDASNRSLLSPKVAVYSATGAVVATASASYGATATVTLSGLTAGKTYYLMATGATADVFHIGGYQLKVQFGGFTAAAASTSTTTTSGTLTSGTATVKGAAAMLAPFDGISRAGDQDDCGCWQHLVDPLGRAVGPSNGGPGDHGVIRGTSAAWLGVFGLQSGGLAGFLPREAVDSNFPADQALAASSAFLSFSPQTFVPTDMARHLVEAQPMGAAPTTGASAQGHLDDVWTNLEDNLSFDAPE